MPFYNPKTSVKHDEPYVTNFARSEICYITAVLQFLWSVVNDGIYKTCSFYGDLNSIYKTQLNKHVDIT